MNIDPQATLVLSPLWLVPAALGIMLVATLALQALQRLVEQPLTELGAAAAGGSPLHRWEPRCKLAALLGFALCAVSLTSLWLVLAALLAAAGGQALSGLPWQGPWRRLQAISGFLVMLVVVLPLTATVRPGDILLQFAGLSGLAINLRGLELALLITGKAWTVALLAEPMLATAAPAATLAGLQQLGLPRRAVSLLLISHRYLFVFRDEAARMRIGMQARGFRPRPSWTSLHDLGNFFGMLLVRSYERTERVQQAMLARGYRGVLPQPEKISVLPADWLAAALVLALGLGLLLADRLAGG